MAEKMVPDIKFNATSIVRFILLFLWAVCLSLLPPKAPTAAADGGLPYALTSALTHHPAVKGIAAELAGQGFTRDAAKAGRYPNLSGQVGTQDDGYDYGTLQVRQPLWAFGKITNTIGLADAQYRVMQLELLQIQRRLLEETATVYVQVLGIRNQLQVAEENVAEHQRLYQGVERRRTGQLASDTDVQLAYSRLVQAQAQRDKIAGELQISLTDLRALTQVETRADTPIAPALLALPDPEKIKSMALDNSADILVKQQLIQVAQDNIALEKVASTPTLYAQASRSFLDSPTANETRVGLSIEGSLNGVGLDNINRVRSARMRATAAQQDLYSTRNDVQSQIDTLLANLMLQTRLQNSRQASVQAVRETKASFMRQYETGRKSWLEVLNMQRELTEQQLQLVQAENTWQTISLRISAVIGQLDAVAGIQDRQGE